MKHITILSLIFTVSFLTGCGGGGGSSVAPTSRSIITNTLRTFSNGDNIQYDLTGSITSSISTLTLTGTGSFTININASPLDPTGTKRTVQALSFTGTLSNGTPFTTNISTYYNQNASGSVDFYGDNTYMWVTAPVTGFVTTLKSPIVSPDQWVNSYTQQNGDTTSQKIIILGKTTVTTAIGVFEAYQYQTDSTITLAAGGTDVLSIINDIVPSIGPIKTTINRKLTDAFGAVTTSQFTLTANTTNIPF